MPGGPPAADPWYERLSPTDAAFLDIETSRAHMHIAGVFLLEGPPPSHAELVAHVASRLDRVPRYRQRLARIPFEAGRPVWVDDPTFRIEHHVRAVKAPSPGDEPAVKQLAARVFAEPLDLDRPPWELRLVEGAGRDRSVLLWKTHHCLMDGIAFVEVITALTDGEALAGPPPPAAPWTPRPSPPEAALLAASVSDQLSRAVEVMGGALLAAVERRRRLLDVVAGMRPLVSLSWRGRARPSSLNQPIGPHRRWEMVAADLADLRQVRARLGGTVNDVLLAVVAGALRKLLGARGDDLTEDLRVFVPVNVRPRDQRSTTGNQISAVYCPLPIGESDARTRLRRITSSMTELKEEAATRGGDGFARLGELVPPLVAAQAARLEVAFRRSNLVVSNVPGPPEPRYLLGRRLLSFHPGVPLSEDQTLSIGAFSHAGTVGFGLLADADRVPDLVLLAAAIPEALAELRALA
jgi:diacylglycerol O-acyltransferase / wax synthase